MSRLLRASPRSWPGGPTSMPTRLFSSTSPRPIMSLTGLTPTQRTVRAAVAQVCTAFPNSYWRSLDASATDPAAFHAALAAHGYLGIALPEALGGAGLGIAEATILLQTVAESGAGMAGAQSVHANVYATQPLARFGTEAQRRRTIPDIVAGRMRVCFGVTEPGAGLNTLALRTTATRQPGDGAGYVVSGQKIWITAAQVAHKMVLLARTTPRSEVQKASDGLSLFCIDLDKTHPNLTVRRIAKMGGRAVDANEVFFDTYPIPADALVGEEGDGWRIVLHGMNAERCLLAGEALGLGYCALARAAQYARERVVFGRPIGQNQGIAHPLAEAYMQLEAARLATYHAAALYDRSTTAVDPSGGGGGSNDPDGDGGEVPTQHEVGVAANTAKYLAAEAAFRACERAVLTLGGMGYAVEYDVERWFRECLVPRIAPVSREMVLNFVGEKVLGLPRSY